MRRKIKERLKKIKKKNIDEYEVCSQALMSEI